MIIEIWPILIEGLIVADIKLISRDSIILNIIVCGTVYKYEGKALRVNTNHRGLGNE